MGVTEEIETVEQDISFGGIVGEGGKDKERDERKKVRVCRDCLGVVLYVSFFLSGLSSTEKIGLNVFSNFSEGDNKLRFYHLTNLSGSKLTKCSCSLRRR